MTWDFACPDWAERLRAGRTLMPNLPLNKADADRAVSIFNKLRLPDVPGQPRMQEAAGEWQRDIVRAVFGSLVDGERMVPEIFCMVPKKNSKTTGGAAITLTGLLMNDRPRAEFIYVGPTQEIADLAFQQSVGMIEADEYLTKRFHIAHHTKTITDRRNKSRLKVKTFDMRVVTGSKPVFILLDEVHLMAVMNGASRIIGQIRGGMIPNPEAVLLMITTQSDQVPSGAFRSELDYARGIRDGRIKEGRVLPLIYEMPQVMQKDQAQWRDPANWSMVLPNLGRSITLERLIADYRSSMEKGDEEERRWASQHLNIEIGLALHSNSWPGAPFWEEQGTKLTLEDVIKRSEVLTIGIDGGGLDDLLGLAVLGREAQTGNWLHWGHAWAHPIALQRNKQEAERFLDFQKDGDLTIVGRIGEDIDQVVAYVMQCENSGKLDSVGVDAAGIGAIVDAIVAENIEPDRIVGISQGWRLNGAIKTTERKVAEGALFHGDSKLMAWCVSNAKIEQHGNAVVITKQTSGSAKVDPLMALFDAVSLMIQNPQPRQKSYTIAFLNTARN